MICCETGHSYSQTEHSSVWDWRFCFQNFLFKWFEWLVMEIKVVLKSGHEIVSGGKITPEIVLSIAQLTGGKIFQKEFKTSHTYYQKGGCGRCQTAEESQYCWDCDAEGGTLEIVSEIEVESIWKLVSG